MENNMMKDMIETWEKGMTDFMDTIVNNQHFMKNFFKTYEPALDSAKQLNEVREKFYEAFGVVSRQDITLMNQKIQNVEIKIADLLEKLEDSENTQKEILKALNNLNQPKSNNTTEVEKAPKAKTKKGN
ncbi:MAG: hypothetical protein WC002_08060 [Candidatus Muiribacteriota bacterium]